MGAGNEIMEERLLVIGRQRSEHPPFDADDGRACRLKFTVSLRREFCGQGSALVNRRGSNDQGRDDAVHAGLRSSTVE